MLRAHFHQLMLKMTRWVSSVYSARASGSSELWGSKPGRSSEKAASTSQKEILSRL